MGKKLELGRRSNLLGKTFLSSQLSYYFLVNYHLFDSYIFGLFYKRHR